MTLKYTARVCKEEHGLTLIHQLHFPFVIGILYMQISLVECRIAAVLKHNAEGKRK
jgi:hypothetical protein